MSIEDLRRNWDGLGRIDPLWAILVSPERHRGGWDGHEDEFFATGRQAVDELLTALRSRDLASGHVDRALDFGCGAGRLTQGLAVHASRVDGVDIAASMVELANKHNQHRASVHYHVNTAPNLELFDDDSFDFILSIIVLQHIPNSLKRQYLREFVRVLKPGGTAAFTVPSHPDLSIVGMLRRAPNSWQNIYRRRRYGYDQVIEFHTMKRPLVEATIRSAGGEVVHCQRESTAGPPFISYLYVVQKPVGG